MTEKTIKPLACGDCNLCFKDQTPEESVPPIKNPVGPEEPNVQFGEPVEEFLRKSREEVNRTRELLGYMQPTAPLTVGDLSIVTEEKRKNRQMDAVREARNAKEGLSIGDLSVCGSRNRRRSLADEMRERDDSSKGLTVGDLSIVTAKKYADKYE